MRDWFAKRFRIASRSAPEARSAAADDWYRRGAAACDEGRASEAIELLGRAIEADPGVAAYHYKLGVAYQSAGAPDRARPSYANAIALDGNHAKAHNNLGSVLHGEGELRAAIEHYERALALDPRLAEAARNLGIAWLDQGDLERAEQSCRRARDLAPDSAETHLLLARVLRRGAHLAEAIEACDRALALSADLARAHNERGHALKENGRLAESAEAFRRTIALAPRSAEAAEAWVNIGLVGELRGEPGAIEYSRRALEILPASAEVRFNYALELLLCGDYPNGWEQYEWRLKLPDHGILGPPIERPCWDGSPAAGKTILLCAEQGHGDTIQFVRYAPLVAELGARVIVCCPAKLAPLLRATPGVAAAIGNRESFPPVDFVCSLLSLARIFRTTLETIPARVPYVFADEAKVQLWRERLAARPGTRKVGLCWATDSRSPTAASRSLRLDELAPLGQVPGVEFYCLQRGAAAAQARRPPAGMKIADLGDTLNDFADDAALISALDLVITSDTATAHLAGALGRPVWTMVGYPPDWRWLLRRADCPWYPTMRLYRRGNAEDWSAVVRRVADALARPGA